MKPTISVLIPAYNTEKTILAAVWSALNQDFDSFEVCVFDDGSTDNTRSLISAISDARLRIAGSTTNMGVVHARNTLLREAKSPFVAWLDADDIMLPGRLQKQFNFLQTHPEVDIVGGWAELRYTGLDAADHKQIKTRVKPPKNPDYLEAAMLFRNPFVNSSIMARNFFVAENLLFDPEFDGFAEDYDLFLRCLMAEKRFGIVSAPVVSYWVRTENEQKKKEVRHKAQEKWERLLCRNFPYTGKDTAGVVVHFLRNNEPLSAEIFSVIKAWLKEAEKVMRSRGQVGTTGAKAALLFQRFRLQRLRFGWVGAFLWLIFRNPVLTISMLRNRTRMV